MPISIYKRPHSFSVKEGITLSIHQDGKTSTSYDDYENLGYYYGKINNEHYSTEDPPLFHLSAGAETLKSSVAADFSGENYLERGFNDLSGKSEISFAAWYRSENTEEEILFTDAEGETGTFKFYSNNSGSRPEIAIYDGFTGFYSITGTKTVNDGEWHHLVATANARATYPTEPHLKLYIDGELDASGSAGTIPGAITATSRFAPVQNQLEELLTVNTGEDISTRFDNYVNMAGGTNNSYIYFVRPITDGIDKWRLRYENGGAAHNSVHIYLLLRNKETGATTSSKIQRWQGGYPNRNYYVDHCRGHSYAQLPIPNALIESGITYNRSNGAGAQIHPVISNSHGHVCRTSSSSNANYPLRTSDNRYYEKGFLQDPPYVGKLMGGGGNDHRFWPPRLYGNDWEDPVYTGYEIYGLRVYQKLAGVTSRMYEFSLYLSGEKYNLFQANPFNNYTELSNESYGNITLGAEAGEDKNYKISGKLDHFSWYGKELSDTDVYNLYSIEKSGIYNNDTATNLKTSGWYEFSNPEMIGFDSHYEESDLNVVRLYHLNDNLISESSDQSTFTKIGLAEFVSGDGSKFGTSHIALSGENEMLYDAGGHELTLTEDFTIEFFIKFEKKPENTEEHTILQTKQYASKSVNYKFSVKTDQFILDIKEGNNDFKTFNSSQTIIENEIWYHIVIGRKDDKIYIIKDGETICEDTMPFYLPLDDAEHGFYLGKGFIGAIEEFRIVKDEFVYENSNLITPPTKQLSRTIKRRNSLNYDISPKLYQDKIKNRKSDALYLTNTQYIETLSDHKAFNFGDENFSFGVWVKPNVVEWASIIGSWNDTSNKSYQLMMFDSNQTFRLLISADGTAHGSVIALESSQNILFEDKWYFIVGIHDADGDMIKLYVYDEKDLLSATSLQWAQGVHEHTPRDDFQINGVVNGMDCATKMHIDQVSIFNKALDVSEITEIWNEGHGVEYKNIQNPSWKNNIISWFDFNNASLLDQHNTNHLSSSTAFTVSNGRRSAGFEKAEDGAEILFAPSLVDGESAFSREGREPVYKEATLNNFPSIRFDKESPSGDFFNTTYNLPESFAIFATISGDNETYAPIISNETDTSVGFAVYNSGNSFRLKIGNQSSDVEVDSDYHTIAATYKSGTGTLYVNGENPIQVEQNLNTLGARPLSIGKHAHLPEDETNTYFNGLMAELIILPEIQESYSGTNSYLSAKYSLDQLKIS